MKSKKSEEKYEEKKNSDTIKNQDNKKNSKTTYQNNCERIFEVNEQAKNKASMNESNLNKMEKELEKIKDNQSCTTETDKKINQNKETTDIKSNINDQKDKAGYDKNKKSSNNSDLKNEVNNIKKFYGKESSPKFIEIKEKLEDKKFEEKKNSINTEIIIINPDEIKEQNNTISKEKEAKDIINNFLNDEDNKENGDKMSLSNLYNNEKEQIQSKKEEICINKNNNGDKMSISSSGQNQNVNISILEKEDNFINENNNGDRMSITSSGQNQNENIPMLSQNNLIYSENNSENEVNEEIEPEENDPNGTVFETVGNNAGLPVNINNINNNYNNVDHYNFDDINGDNIYEMNNYFNYLEEENNNNGENINGMNNYFNYLGENNVNNNDDILQNMDFANIEANYQGISKK